MISLPIRKQKLPKVCRVCNIAVDKSNGVVRSGYLIRLCLDCRLKKSQEYNEKRRKNKGDKWF